MQRVVLKTYWFKILRKIKGKNGERTVKHPRLLLTPPPKDITEDEYNPEEGGKR